MKELIKVVTVDQWGLSVEQEDGFETFKDADQEAKECISRWGDDGQDFWVETYVQEKPKEIKVRYYNNNAVDGWEDMFPSYE